MGESAIIGAGSVVTKNVPDWMIVKGVPANFLRKADHEMQLVAD